MYIVSVEIIYEDLGVAVVVALDVMHANEFEVDPLLVVVLNTGTLNLQVAKGLR